MLVTFSQISLYFLNHLSSVIKKGTYLVSLKSFLYAVIFCRSTCKRLIFFSIFVANKGFKSFFTKGEFIRHNNFINVFIFLKKVEHYKSRKYIFLKVYITFCFGILISSNVIIFFHGYIYFQKN